VHRVPPIVNALLIPDMPVAFWWIGDLPSEHQSYVDRLLEPADRLIVDSSHFDSADDLALVRRIAEETTTAPADLNWVRLEDWRAATAAIFDPAAMRTRLRRIREVRVCATTSRSTFGDSAESFLYAAWLTQSAETQLVYHFDTDKGRDTGSLSRVDITFDDGTNATIIHDEERNVLTATVDGVTRAVDSVTRTLSRSTENLIVRQLKRAEADRVFVRVLPLATELARR
jgi:glucose-6-phosphate dehydrogenase assembly protein OpcA